MVAISSMRDRCFQLFAAGAEGWTAMCTSGRRRARIRTIIMGNPPHARRSSDLLEGQGPPHYGATLAEQPGSDRVTAVGWSEAFARDGFMGPWRVFTPAECRRIAAYLHREDVPAPLEWDKGRAVAERFLYDLAVHPAILPIVTAILGPDVILWGVKVVGQDPGETHPWHTDIESASNEGGFLTVWTAIENVSSESGLQLISRSHTIGKTVQEVRFERGLRRDAPGPEMMLAMVREREPLASLVQPDMTDGEALFFDGRLWHGSHNNRRRGRRLALLVQFAAADRSVRIPDFSELDWPFLLRAAPRPPVILVSGTDRAGIHRLLPPPPPSAKGCPMTATLIHHFDLPLENPDRAHQSFLAFRGPTRTVDEMGCHASVLAGGHSPHRPHAHPEEEILIPLHGDVELLIAEAPDDASPRVERIGPGSLVYYPAGQHHSIRNPGATPVGYLMFKWRAAACRAQAPLRTSIFRYGDLTPPAGAAAFWTHRIFEGPTEWLGTLHSHLSVVQPGGGYAPHADAHDVAIVLLSGKVETLRQIVEPTSVIFYSGGELHGLHNAGTEPARYLVFEFHAPGTDVPRIPLLKARIVRVAKRLARPVWHRLKAYLPGRR